MYRSVFAAPDTITLVFGLRSSPRILSPALGSYSQSHELQFAVPLPNLGSGDLNGDGVVDIVDSTLLRRSLAGLDP